MNTREIQSRLKALSYDPGPIDGVRGRRTIAAIKAFQRDRGLVVDGIVGPNTRRALTGGKKSPSSRPEGPPWLELAGSLLGTAEIVGRANNPEIMRWADELDLTYPNDETPWCGLFVGHCIAATLPDEVLPNNVLLARAWQQFGRPTKPRLGAVLVFWRGSRTSWSGHVGFYVGETNTHYVVRGGNQSNKVSDMRLAKGRLLEARWPLTSPDTAGAPPVDLDVDPDDAPISENEA